MRLAVPIILLGACAAPAPPTAVPRAFSLADELPGAPCIAGGVRIDQGEDTDGDGALGASEVTSSQYVCKDSPVLVRSENAPPWDGCPSGGKVLALGADTDSDGLLGEAEATSRSRVCLTPDNGDFLIGNVTLSELGAQRMLIGDLTIAESELDTIALPDTLVEVTGEIEVRFCNAITRSIVASSLHGVGTVHIAVTCPDVAELNLPALAAAESLTSYARLETLDLSSLVTGNIRLEDAQLETLSLPAYRSGSLKVVDASLLTAVDAPLLLDLDRLDLTGAPLLVDFHAPLLRSLREASLYDTPSFACGLWPILRVLSRVMDDLSSFDLTVAATCAVGSSRVDLQACKLEYSIVSPK